MNDGPTAPGGRTAARATVVLEAEGQWFADEGRIVEGGLRARAGVLSARANPVAQTVTVTYDPAVTDPGELRRCVVECGYHCAGESAPRHLCTPLAPPAGRQAGPDA